MHHIHISLYARVVSMPIYRVLVSLAFMILLLSSQSSYAITTNPGATCQGIAGAAQGSFTPADYTQLSSKLGTYNTIAGNDGGRIPLQIRMTTSETNGPPTSGSFSALTVGGDSAFNIVRDFPSVTSITSVDFDFRNTITQQPIFLTNVALSAFDIDYVNNNANSFDDYVLFTGVTESGATIDGSFRTLTAAGSNILSFRERVATRATFPGLGLYFNGTNGDECAGTNLDTKCQGSVQFEEPVRSVKVRYSNADFRIDQQDPIGQRNPTNQQIFFRVDNYCYVPQYIFSGTVFDDNGGIVPPQANAAEPNYTTGTYNNTNYFNGVFNKSPESGIAGSTVRLASCDRSTTYATQAVGGSGATIGQFQFSVPLSTFGANRSICLIESRPTGTTTYPIRTTSDLINNGFATTTYNYPDKNFGRVIAENVALVLKKSQYINNCPATLNYASIGDTTSPSTGFSSALVENIEPGRCIAYKITATNRANVNIDNFIMEDILQNKGVNNAVVTSVLANPALATADYNTTSGPTGSPAIGANGTVRTKPLILQPRTKRDFYFNTKYGTSQ